MLHSIDHAATVAVTQRERRGTWWHACEAVDAESCGNATTLAVGV